MTRKNYLLACIAFVSCLNSNAQTNLIPTDPIPFIPENGNPTDDEGSSGDKNRPRTPVLIPYVALDNHTLYLYSGCDNTTLELYDEDETLVYNTNIPEGTEQITLPNDLTGVFELRIIRGSITFVAEIEL